MCVCKSACIQLMCTTLTPFLLPRPQHSHRPAELTPANASRPRAPLRERLRHPPVARSVRRRSREAGNDCNDDVCALGSQPHTLSPSPSLLSPSLTPPVSPACGRGRHLTPSGRVETVGRAESQPVLDGAGWLGGGDGRGVEGREVAGEGGLVSGREGGRLEGEIGLGVALRLRWGLASAITRVMCHAVLYTHTNTPDYTSDTCTL